MLLSVYLLRHEGRRLSSEEARNQTPAVGHVRIDREPGGRPGHWQRVARLIATDDRIEPLLQLHDIQLQRWDRQGLVIAGTEVHWYRKDRTSYRQSWFIPLPPPEGATNIAKFSAPSPELVGAA